MFDCKLFLFYLFVGESIDFTVDIQPSPDYPVDFYILMDLTATMADDLQNVKKLAQNICKFECIQVRVEYLPVIHVLSVYTCTVSINTYCHVGNLISLSPSPPPCL